MKVGVVGKAVVLTIGGRYAVGIITPRQSVGGEWHDSTCYLCENDKYYVDTLHLNAILYQFKPQAQEMVDKYNTSPETFS